MDEIVLHNPDHGGNCRSKSMFYCGICGKIWGEHEDLAVKCCTCDECHKTIAKGESSYSGRHRGCEDLRRLRRTEAQLAKAEKLVDWNGPVYDDDQFFEDLDAYVEHLHETLEPTDEWPEWVYTCDELPFPALDLDDVIENLCEDHGVEDFSSDDIDVPKPVWDSLVSAVAAFNASTKESTSASWHPDFKRVVAVPPREVQ